MRKKEMPLVDVKGPRKERPMWAKVLVRGLVLALGVAVWGFLIWVGGGR